MNKQYLPNFNHNITLLGGQSFSWDLVDPNTNTYIGVTQDRAIKIKFDKDYLYWQTFPEKDDFDFIKNYFWLDIDYEEIIQTISQDKYIKEAFNVMPNIRILRQPFDMTLLSFIISANNNITSIRKSIRELSKMFGQKIKVDGEYIYLFPKTEIIADESEDNLRKSKIGFHAKYVKKSAIELVKQDLKSKIYNLNEEEARKQLVQLPGVGNKIADCALVFSLGFENLTPVDVWAKRFLTDLYKLPENWKYEQFRSWIKKHFWGYASWADQFLFEWYRKQEVGGRK